MNIKVLLTHVQKSPSRLWLDGVVWHHVELHATEQEAVSSEPFHWLFALQQTSLGNRVIFFVTQVSRRLFSVSSPDFQRKTTSVSKCLFFVSSFHRNGCYANEVVHYLFPLASYASNVVRGTWNCNVITVFSLLFKKYINDETNNHTCFYGLYSNSTKFVIQRFTPRHLQCADRTQVH